MPKIPAFSDENQAAKWFATHDTAPFMDELEEVAEKIPVRRTRAAKQAVDLRLRSDYVTAIKQTARRKRVPYKTLIERWVTEKLRQESPDLMPKPGT